MLASKTANLVLQDTIERIFAKDVYADIQRGIFIVRGENVVMLGEIVCLSDLCYVGPYLTCNHGRILTRRTRYQNHTEKQALRKSIDFQ